MSILKVARMGHPLLRQKARPVEKHELKDPGTQRFIDDMIDTMREYSGVGLAAPHLTRHANTAIPRQMLLEIGREPLFVKTMRAAYRDGFRRARHGKAAL